MACTISSHLDWQRTSLELDVDTPGTWRDNMHLYWHLFKVTLEIVYLNFYMLITIVVSFREYRIKGGDTDSVEPGFPISLFPGIFRSVVPKLVCQHLYHWCYQVSKNPALLGAWWSLFFYSYRSNLLVLTWRVSTKSRASCSRNSKVRSFPSCSQAVGSKGIVNKTIGVFQIFNESKERNNILVNKHSLKMENPSFGKGRVFHCKHASPLFRRQTPYITLICGLYPRQPSGTKYHSDFPT